MSNVNHFVWSTLPNVEKISNGQYVVPKFTGKAEVDHLVKDAEFENYIFIQPPFYFQNFKGHTAPQRQQDGSIGWALPIDPTHKVIHIADINDLGKVVAGVFLNPDKVGNGSYLSLAAELNNFNDVLEVFKANGKDYRFTYVPAEIFSNFFEGAREVAELLAYFEAYSYMGPNSDNQVQKAKEISTEPFVSLNDWIKLNVL
ncbi:NmrA family NAD(P)-binding protein [Chryseobacterium sp. SSA4.19]|uniref:NmrA family NAD(P)-binding protein n=1 Tax=Chryseobacterium sp. SSA4.19 TaxID=2919915 RepID=UPI0034A20B23